MGKRHSENAGLNVRLQKLEARVEELAEVLLWLIPAVEKHNTIFQDMVSELSEDISTFNNRYALDEHGLFDTDAFRNEDEELIRMGLRKAKEDR